MLQKRKLGLSKNAVSLLPPSKRSKQTPDDLKNEASSASKQNLLMQGSGTEDKPKKPLSAYIYFSQEFREIIRSKFPFLTVAQIMKAVSNRWQTLTKEQKQPFEQIANEDKQRYDKEVFDFKKGVFQGRQATPQMKLQNQLDNVAKALEVNDDILSQLQISNHNLTHSVDVSHRQSKTTD